MSRTETHSVTIDFTNPAGEDCQVVYYVKLADSDPAHLATDRAIERFDRLYPKCDFVDAY